MNIGMPRLSAVYPDATKTQQQLNHMFGFLLIISTITIGIFVMYGQTILGWFGPAYTKGYTTLLILTVGQAIHLLYGVSGSILKLANHAQPVNISHIIMFLSSILLGFILIPNFSSVGAALSVTLPFAAVYLWQDYYMKQKTGFSCFYISRQKSQG